MCHDVSTFSLDPDTPACVEGEAAPKALDLRPARCGRGGGERPVGQETAGYRGLLAADASAAAGGSRAPRTPHPAATGPELPGWLC